MTVKDAFRVQGYRTTYGYRMFRNYRPKTDSRVIKVLREQGVVILGRTSVPTGSFDWNCRNEIHPECVNPFDSTRTPGGSSGGAAAALALHLTPMELGSDFHGSLRYPAHCCGVYSLRTTDGWLPIEDWGPEKFPPAFERIATCGPMAKSLEDLQQLLTVYEDAFPLPATDTSSGTLKIAYSRQLLGVKPDSEIMRLYDAMVARLAEEGHEVLEVAPDFDWESLEHDFGLVGGYEFARLLPRFLRFGFVKSLYARLALQSRLGTGPFLTHFRQGMLASKTEYEAALQRREELFSGVQQFFSQHDLWMLPVSPTAAIPLKLCGKVIQTEQGKMEYLRYLGAYLGATSLLGTPALTVPIGRGQNGLPVGVQVHGARYTDSHLVRMARKLPFHEC